MSSNNYWDPRSTSEIFRSYGHKLLVATAGRDPNYSSEFSNCCPSYHRDGHNWSTEEHELFFKEGLFQYYFAKMISFRTIKFEFFSQSGRLLKILGPRMGEDDKSHFEKNVYSLFYRWSHHDETDSIQDRKLRASCLTHLKEQTEGFPTWPGLSSAASIANLVRNDPILANLGARFQKCKALEEHGKLSECRELLELPVLNNEDYHSYDWDFNQAFANLQMKICYRINLYLDEFDRILLQNQGISVEKLDVTLNDRDWAHLTLMTEEQFSNGFQANCTL